MNIERSILPNLGKTVKFLDLLVEEKLAAAGIPLSKLQFVFLMIISRNNEKPQQNLAELTGRDKTTFTRNINTLERKNLVIRKSSDKDKRIKLVCITDLGIEYMKTAMPVVNKLIQEIESDISDQERDQFLITLSKIKNKLQEVRTKFNSEQ
jgi:DNA-binding MarR family transcriptional regulator